MCLAIPFNHLEVVNCYRKSFELQFVDKMMQILYRPLNKMDDGFFDNGHIVKIFLALQSWYFDNRIERRRTNMTIAMMKTYKTYLSHYNLLESFKAFANTEELVILPTFNKETFLKKVVDLYSTQKPTGANVHRTYNLLNEELNAMHNLYTLHIMKHVAKLIYAFMDLCEEENFYTIFKMDPTEAEKDAPSGTIGSEKSMLHTFSKRLRAKSPSTLIKALPCVRSVIATLSP